MMNIIGNPTAKPMSATLSCSPVCVCGRKSVSTVKFPCLVLVGHVSTVKFPCLVLVGHVLQHKINQLILHHYWPYCDLPVYN